MCHGRLCKLAKFQCPNCVKLGLVPSYFCSQDCFKTSWNVHKATHKAEAAKPSAPAPPKRMTAREIFGNPDDEAEVDDTFAGFTYTGPLRPGKVTPMRKVPDHIPKPDYAADGVPHSELAMKSSRAIELKSPAQIKNMREASRIGREILDLCGKVVKAGMTTDELDVICHEAIVARNAYPSPLNYHNFPKSLCTSVNEVICHGIPDDRPLEDGDIVNCDITVFYNGVHADLNETFLVGKVDPDSQKLVQVTFECLEKAIEIVKPNALFRDVGNVISRHANLHGFSVVRSYCGHGIGELFHTTPSIPHYGKNKAVGVMKPGMIFTIEPMINAGSWKDKLWPDNWTAVTVDGKRSAQFEHTLLVTESGCEVLTARTSGSYIDRL